MIPVWAQNPLRLRQLVVFNATLQGIFVLIAQNTSVLAAANELLAIHNTAAPVIIAPSASALHTWLDTAQTDAVLSVTPQTTFSSTVLLRKTQVQELSSMREIPTAFDVVPVVQIFRGGNVTVQGRGLIFSIVHLPLLTVDSPFTFTVLVIFLADTFRYIVW